jgi:lysophospholipase L1-like esterase
MKLARCLWLAVLLLMGGVVVLGQEAVGVEGPATRPVGPERFAEAIESFEARDRESPPAEGGILFIGSSSIRGWDLEAFFEDLPVINRGFGGSRIADSVYFADRIVLPYRPRVIVFYAGENDVNGGKSPRAVADDFEEFVGKVRAELPETRIVFIGLKPSPSRWGRIEQFRETNRLIEDYIATQEGMVFIDVEPAMLDENGEPRGEMYRTDRLHLTREGYEVWAELVRPHLE